MVDPELARQFARDIVMLKLCGINPIVVHGGGPQINRMLDKLQVKSEFRDGLRVTDKETMEVVEMVLAGSINKAIVGLDPAGRRPRRRHFRQGRQSADRRALRQDRRPIPRPARSSEIDFGFVGEPHRVNTEILDTIMKSDAIPVIAPDRRRLGRRDLQRQCRHGGRRHRHRDPGQAPAAAHRRGGRARQATSS